jgi:serine/threonine protein kinase
MEKISVERWIGEINLSGKSAASLREMLNAEDVTEIDDLTDMSEGELSGLALNGRVLKKLRSALHKLGNDQILKSEGRGSIASSPPLPPVFSEKWRIQVKLFEVAASAMTTGKLIGSGGFARVYEGSINEVPVAIKKFEVSSNQHEQYMGMIKRETRPLSRVRHPNIIQLHHVCLEKGHLAIATELAPNGSLDEYLQTHPDTSLAQLFFFGHGIIAGMKRLHANQPKPILHNDLKPANVLVGAMLEPKLADFGSSTGGHTTTTNGAGATGSTPKYEAPELLEGKAKSKKSDVYAFGVTFYEVMTGLSAWDDMSATEIMSAVGHRRERPAFPAGCHPFVEEIVSACWASDPAQRPSFDELNQRFNEARMAHPSFREEPPQTPSASSAFVRELVVVVSSPGKTLEQEEVMKMVEATAETHADLIFGYDWAGSSTQDPRDGGVDWSDPDSVAESFWFKGFRERVKGQVLALAQVGYQLRLLCIEGGPISQLEARTMATMRAEIVTDLPRLGYTPAVSTQLFSFS